MAPSSEPKIPLSLYLPPITPKIPIYPLRFKHLVQLFPLFLLRGVSSWTKNNGDGCIKEGSVGSNGTSTDFCFVFRRRIVLASGTFVPRSDFCFVFQRRIVLASITTSSRRGECCRREWQRCCFSDVLETKGRNHDGPTEERTISQFV